MGSQMTNKRIQEEGKLVLFNTTYTKARMLQDIHMSVSVSIGFDGSFIWTIFKNSH